MGSHIPRLWLPQTLSDGEGIAVTETARIHHLKDVLRLKAGDRISVFNEKNGEHLAEISTIAKNGISLRIGRQTRTAKAATPLHLFFSPIKKQALEWLIEKTAELAVTHYHPLLMAHSQVRDINNERMHSIAIAAAEQSGRLDVPHFMPLQNLSQTMAGALRSLPLFIAVEPSKDSSPAPLAATKAECAVLIGPEGGFSTEEIAQLLKLPNATVATLGSNTLRAETAAVVACGIIHAGRKT